MLSRTGIPAFFSALPGMASWRNRGNRLATRHARNGWSGADDLDAYRREIEGRSDAPSRRGIIAMMIVTGLYLVVEVAFGARLLDVVSSTMNEDEIHQIEIAGRMISGFALTLVVWSVFVLPWCRRSGAPVIFRALALSLSLAACCAVSYTIQEAILDGITHGSSAEQRRAATSGTLMAAAYQKQNLVLTGLDLDEEARSLPETKTFMSLLPALALRVDDLDRRLETELDKILYAQAIDMMGGDPGFYNDVYLPSESAMKEAFNSYIEAADPHAQARAEVAPRQAETYKAYRKSLGRYRPEQIRRQSDISRVRSNVQSTFGLSLPLGWKPTDKAAFMDAVEAKIMGSVGPAYEQAMKEIFGEVIPDDLDEDSFFRHGAVQRLWRKEIGLDYDIPLRLGLTAEEVRRVIMEPWAQEIVKDRRQIYLSPVENFEPDGEQYEEGLTAIRLAYIPLIAFGFSIFGALVHTFKTVNFGAQAVIGYGSAASLRKMKIAKVAIIAVTVGVGLTISQISNPVTNSVLFTELEDQTREKATSFVSVPIRMVVQMQPFVYPIAESLRSALGGITFDFDETTRTPLFEKFPDYW